VCLGGGVLTLLHPIAFIKKPCFPQKIRH